MGGFIRELRPALQESPAGGAMRGRLEIEKAVEARKPPPLLSFSVADG
jgi:hypothetical protein